MEKNPFLTEEKEMIVIARLVTVIMTDCDNEIFEPKEETEL